MDDIEKNEEDFECQTSESFEELEEELLYFRECCKLFAKEFYKIHKHLGKYNPDSKFAEGYKAAWADCQMAYHSTFSKDLYQNKKSYFSKFDNLQKTYLDLKNKYNTLVHLLKSKQSFIHGQTVKILLPSLNKITGTVISVTELEKRLTVSYIDENINRSVQIVCYFDEVEKYESNIRN